MRAQLVSENINFERGGKDHIYTKIGIGERERVLKFLDEIANDIQFQKDEPEYMGYLNVKEDLIYTGLMDSEALEAYRMFVKNWKKYLQDMEERRLFLVDPPTLDETTFYDEPEPEYGVHAIRDIRESLEFERGKDPKKTMGIGIPKYRLEAEAKFPDKKIAYYHLDRGNSWEYEYNGKFKEFSDPARFVANKDFIVIVDDGEAIGYIYGLTLSQRIRPWYGTGFYDADAVEHSPEWESMDESVNFERGRDPLAAMGLGQIARIPLLILKADLESGYGIDGFPGTIYNVKVISPRRFQINFNTERIKDLSTNKTISKPNYANLLVSNIGMDKLITNVNHAHGTGNSWIFTLDPKYANVMPRETFDYDDLGDDDPLKESLRFERGKEPYDALDIGKKALLKKKANEIEWDWYPGPEELENEEVIDIRQYKGFNTKIAKLPESKDSAWPDEVYYAVSDTGEPYFVEPTFYKDPENAWHDEMKFLDEYFEENQ
jgi:hypothetical protein